MAEETFDLIFHGELVPGSDPAQVKQNLARLFKMDLARVEKLFSGKPIVLKRGVSMDTAAKYRVAIKKAGARISTVASTTAEQKSAPKEARGESAPKETSAEPMPQNTASERAARTAPASQSPGMTLAPVEGDLVKAHERQQQSAVEVDTSALSLRPDGQSLVDENELVRPAPVPVEEPHLDLEPAGADVLKPEERRKLPEVEIDLSHLSASEPGERLEAVKPAPPPAPDVSGISLVDDD